MNATGLRFSAWLLEHVNSRLLLSVGEELSRPSQCLCVFSSSPFLLSLPAPPSVSVSHPVLVCAYSMFGPFILSLSLRATHGDITPPPFKTARKASWRCTVKACCQKSWSRFYRPNWKPGASGGTTSKQASKQTNKRGCVNWKMNRCNVICNHKHFPYNNCVIHRNICLLFSNLAKFPTSLLSQFNTCRT